MVRKINKVGRKIKKKLIDKGLSQAEFCRMHGISQKQFCDAIHTMRYPGTIKKVCELLDISA